MKKFLIAIAVLVLALALVACGGEAANKDTTPPTDEAIDHVHAYNEELVAPTCTTAGSRKMVCACGDVQSEENLGLADHTPSAPDCEKDTVCTVCNAVVAPAAGHTMGATETITAATCGTAGKEKATCLTCGKTVETDVPAKGHALAKGGAVAATADGFSITCASCGKSVTVKAQAPLFQLTFESDVAAEAEGNALGLKIVNPNTAWKIQEVNGSKALLVEGLKPNYIDIPSVKPFEELGIFLISFEYTTTTESAAGSKASIFSVLGNFYNGKPTQTQNDVKWGWAVKLLEDNKVMATINGNNPNASNSIAVARNVKYNVQIVVDAASTAKHVFINGTYIGNGGQGVAFAGAADNTLCFRFGDGPNCGHAIDNFTISPLK